MKRLAGVVLCSAWLLSGCVVVGGSDSESGTSGAGFFFLLLPMLLVFAAFRMMRRSRRTTATRRFAGQADQRGPSASMLRAELSVLSDDVLRLEPQVTLKPEARDDYEAALHRYRVAQTALDDTDAPVDLIRVERVVDEASWLMARVRAVLDDRPLPPLPARLQLQGAHGEPAVDVDDGDQPRYVDSPASFRSGWFAVGPGLFGGLLIGSMLGDGFGGWADDEEYHEGEWDEPLE